MMKTYVATYVSGFIKLVPRILTSHYADVKVLESLDGLIVFRTAADLKECRYFNNVFLLLQQFRFRSKRPMNVMLTSVCQAQKAAEMITVHKPASSRSFRIVTSRENKLVSVDNHLLQRAEQFLAAATGMGVDRSRPDIELWCLQRREGTGFFMMRLTKHGTTERTLHKGELRPELASLLCALSEPHDHDVFVDPCCGYGSIPLARARLAPYKTIYALDNDTRKIKDLKKKLQTGDLAPSARSWRIYRGDALQLDMIENESVDKIVTDPPWGIFDSAQAMDLEFFYRDLLKECTRILRSGGTLVILTARKELLNNALQNHPGILAIADTYHILVSGKKAAAYKLIKR